MVVVTSVQQRSQNLISFDIYISPRHHNSQKNGHVCELSPLIACTPVRHMPTLAGKLLDPISRIMSSWYYTLVQVRALGPIMAYNYLVCFSPSWSSSAGRPDGRSQTSPKALPTISTRQNRIIIVASLIMMTWFVVTRRRRSKFAVKDYGLLVTLENPDWLTKHRPWDGGEEIHHLA